VNVFTEPFPSSVRLFLLRNCCLATDVVALSFSRPLPRNECCFKAVTQQWLFLCLDSPCFAQIATIHVGMAYSASMTFISLCFSVVRHYPQVAPTPGTRGVPPPPRARVIVAEVPLVSAGGEEASVYAFRAQLAAYLSERKMFRGKSCREPGRFSCHSDGIRGCKTGESGFDSQKGQEVILFPKRSNRLWGPHSHLPSLRGVQRTWRETTISI
jgi:hypothetical protein